MRRFIWRIIFLILLLLVIVNSYTGFIAPTGVMYIGVSANVYLIIAARKFKPLTLMFLFWLTFIINLIPYYENGHDISGPYYQLDIPAYYDMTMSSHVIFLLFTALLIPRIKEPIYLNKRLNFKKEPFPFWFTFIFMLLIFLFGAKGQSIFSAGGYGKSNVEGLGNLAIYEYFVILIPPGLIYAGNSKPLKRLLYILILLYSIKTLGLGGRNLLIQIGMLLFVLFDNERIKYKYLIATGFVPVYFFLIFGYLRQNPLMLFTGSLTDILLLPVTGSFDLLITQNDVFYSSVRFFAFIEEGIITGTERITVFLFNIIAVVMPFKYLPDFTNISLYRRDIYNCGGGGLISAYYYLFLGIPGLGLIAAYISYVIRKSIVTKSKYWIIYIVAFLSTFVRWFAYNPIIIFKLCVFGVLYVCCIEILKSIVKLRDNVSESQK
jgi:hypothetical protein